MEAGSWSIQQRRGLRRRAALQGLVALAAGTATVLAGCRSERKPRATGGAASPQPPDQAAATAASTDFIGGISVNPPDPFTDRDIQPGGTLTRLFNRQITLDFITSSSGPPAEVSTPVYSRLVRMANRANMKSISQIEIEGDLATKWEQVDLTTLIFTLAPNIKFHPVPPVSGRALRVEDIKYSFNRGKTYPRSLYKVHYNRIARVEDTGGGTVKMMLTEPYPAILQLLSVFYMAIVPPEIGDNPDVAQSTAVGTGGFMLVKNTPNVEYVYQKHPEFFKLDALGRRRPYIGGYTLAIVTDEATRLAMLETGKADCAYTAAVPINLDNVEDFARRNPRIVLQRREPPFPYGALVGHHDRTPWSDPRVRRAAALAMDHNTIIKTMFRGYATVGPFFPWAFLFERPPSLKDLGPNYVYNPQEAKQLLAAAGFPNGLDLDLHWYEAPTVEQTVTLYQQSAARAGLRINLVKAPDAASHLQKQSARQWSGLLFATRSGEFLDPAATMPAFLPGAAANFGNVNDPVLVALNTRVENTLGEERKAIARQIWDHLLSEVYEVTFPAAHIIAPWAPRMHNMRDTPWSANGGFGMGQMDGVWLSK